MVTAPLEVIADGTAMRNIYTFVCVQFIYVYINVYILAHERAHGIGYCFL